VFVESKVISLPFALILTIMSLSKIVIGFTVLLASTKLIGITFTKSADLLKHEESTRRLLTNANIQLI
ncbi:hypothetical protein, partial [Streptococcus suis]|uniref:hypothetical protein n=1 Tax=Streptococcus suis TaxID=1307 RepID=UPI001EE971BF